MTLAVCGRKFRAAAKVNASGNSTGPRINGRSGSVIAVEGEHPLRSGIIDDTVRTLAGLGGPDLLETFEIEDSDLVGFVLTGKAAAKLARDGNAMHPLD